MRGFPGFVNQKVGGAAPTLPSLPSPAMLPKAPAVAAPAMPQMPVLARPLINLPAPPATPVVVVPVLRPVTVATVTRNLQAALGPAAPPPAPTTQGFPGFISRNFNQVSQHQPGTSNSNHLSGLANLFNQGPAAPERRQSRPAPVRPATPPAASPAAAPTPTAPAKPAVTIPVAVKKPAPPKAPLPASQPAELPKPTVAVQAKTAPPKTTPAQAQSPSQAPAKAVEPPKPELSKSAAPAKLKEEEEQKRPPVALLRGGKLGEGKARVKAQKAAPAAAPASSSSFKPAAEAPKLEAKPPSLESKPATRETEPTKPIAETKNSERVEGPTTVAKAPATIQTPQAPPAKANLEKLAQARPENSEVKVGELQRQQVNSLQAPVSREQLALSQQSGAGLSAGGGSGQGGGGGQQGRRRRQQEDGEGVEEIGGAESLGGDDQVQWWHLRGEENLRALSSELREAMFLLRTPQRPLGVAPKEVRVQKTPRRQEVEQAQIQVREEEQRQVFGDQVQLEASDLCKACGHDLDGIDPRRCPACLRQAALATLALLVADGRFLAYRVFLTLCRQPVASRAVYHLRDFSSLPSGAYWVRAA